MRPCRRAQDSEVQTPAPGIQSLHGIVGSRPPPFPSGAMLVLVGHCLFRWNPEPPKVSIIFQKERRGQHSLCSSLWAGLARLTLRWGEGVAIPSSTCCRIRCDWKSRSRPCWPRQPQSLLRSCGHTAFQRPQDWLCHL